MNWIGEISINQVLAEIRSEPDRPFWLLFVRSTGRDRGTLKTVAKCLYGGALQSGKVHISRDDRKRSLHISAGTLPCTDYEKGNYITPKISHIVGYNLMKVIH